MNLFAGPSNGSVPSFSGSVSAMSVRFHHGSVPSLSGSVSAMSVRFIYGSVPSFSGSVSALPVWFHYGSVPSRFGSTAFRFGFSHAGSVHIRFGSCWSGSPVPGSVPRPSCEGNFGRVRQLVTWGSSLESHALFMKDFLQPLTCSPSSLWNPPRTAPWTANTVVKLNMTNLYKLELH